MLKTLLPAILAFFSACSHGPDSRHAASFGQADCRMTCAMETNSCATVCEGNGDCSASCVKRGDQCTSRCLDPALAAQHTSSGNDCKMACAEHANDCAIVCRGNADCTARCETREAGCAERCER
jgi:hypothetical protein